MSKLYILKYTISVVFVLFVSFSWSQEEIKIDSLQQTELDSTQVKNIYGIRVGIDISRPIIQMIQKEDLGVELTADYRVAKNWYAAVELGYESEPGFEDLVVFHTKGSYAKIGFNYNAYENWEGMNNEVYVGLRYAFSRFEQELNSYTIVDFSDYLDNYTISPDTTFDGLSAHWAELHVGLKVETLPNLFLTAGMHFKKLISDKEPERFANLYIPGFNSVLLNRNGIGFNYTISYLIPIKKK